jgi:4-amino-4-deoxy-L-arabinose transferase-like glycosyltransferase
VEKVKIKMSFFKKNNYLILIVLIILLAIFLRFWRLPEYMTFLGDEGRDALVVKRMIVDHKFRLIGPVTSVGNMYLGPLYYYLMLPAMMISRLSPIGPAAMVALLGILTTALIYFYGREWVGSKASLFAAFLYAISPVVITFSRSSWNPNVMPFFALVSVYGLWRIWQKKQFFWLLILGVTVSFAVQSHWLGLLLLPTVIIFWAMALGELLRSKKPTGLFWRQTLIGFFIFLCLTVAPLVWFDLRHGFLNSKAFMLFIGNRQNGSINFKIYEVLPRLWDLNREIFTRLLAGKNLFWGFWISLVMTLMVVLKIIRESLLANWHRFITRNPGLFLLLVWFLVGLLGLSVYRQNIYDHYFGFLFPIPFLLAGWFLAMIWHGKIPGKILALLFLSLPIFLAVKESPLHYSPSRQLQKTQAIASFVLEKAQDKPFNLALIAERNYDEAYAFFMEKWGRPPIRIEPQKAEETITPQLFVICEQPNCQPIFNPKAEIAMWGWSKVDEKWSIEGIEIYKLSHNNPQR